MTVDAAKTLIESLEAAAPPERRADGALTGVIGDPARHSKSPLIHNHWLQAGGLTGLYAPFEVNEASADAFLRLAPELGVKGLNVTTPHKQRAWAFCQTVTARAARVEAVNTIIFDQNGAAYGDSTDGWGFVASLEAAGWTPSGASVLMLGAGGAAGAIVDALLDAGIEHIVICNRTRSRAEAVAARSPRRAAAADWSEAARKAESAGLIVNATTLGMGEAADGRVWPDLFGQVRLQPEAVATDLIYAPLDTPFLRAARLAGARTVDGLGMLLHQARPGFAAWHGVWPEVTDALRAAALDQTGYLP